jgi:hypothetical protein
MLNHHLSEKLKLIGNDEFNRLINILTKIMSHSVLVFII